MTTDERKGYLMALQTMDARLVLIKVNVQNTCCGLAFNNVVSQARKVVKELVAKA